MSSLVIWYESEANSIKQLSWDLTGAVLNEGFIALSTTLDWSNPDEGIFLKRKYCSYLEGEEGSVFELYETKDPRGSVLVTPQELLDVLVVQVDGVAVLVKDTRDIPRFSCGLCYPQDLEDPQESAGTISLGAVGAVYLNEDSHEEE